MSRANNTSRYIEIFQNRFPDFEIIASSITEKNDIVFALARNGTEKKLILAGGEKAVIPSEFQGTKVDGEEFRFLVCNLNHENAEALRSFLPYTKPVTLGNASSFGFGDRLGNAGPAHLQALIDSEPVFKPVLAQQSIRELDRTGRTAGEVMDAATWTVFREGYKDGFGSDADHLKTPEDIDRMIRAGFTMFTIDPSDHVNNQSQNMNGAQLQDAFKELPWDDLNDEPDKFLQRYVGQTFRLANDHTLEPSQPAILRAAVKYGNVVRHTLDMFRYLTDTYPEHDTEVELSVDETPHPTTPEEHLIIASELQRLGVKLVSLAPRFCGDFEKGIDFKGDLDAFRDEYLLHQAIAGEYGDYKLSIHSGSDKFSVYEAIGELGEGRVHVKTAGTSYLEAIRAVAMTDTALFREIMSFSIQRFETDRKTYHISADAGRLGDPDDYRDEELPGLLDDDNARQVFHVTFGSVLTHVPEKGAEPGFRERIMEVLERNEKVHEDCLYKHFRRHIAPFEKVYDEQQIRR